MKTHVWNMTRATWEKFSELKYLMEMEEEDTDEWWALSEEIGTLPGHPNSSKGEMIYIEITTVQH